MQNTSLRTFFTTIVNEIQKPRNLSRLILLFAFLIRIIGITSVPGGVNQDEAMLAMDAWALSKYGTDRYGMFMPVHFTAWKYGQMSVLLAYLMVPFIKILGFHTLAVRLPMAIISTIGIAALYGVSKKLFSEKTALIVLILTAVNPWHFMQSRWALDCNLFPHIFIIGVYLLLTGLEKRHLLYLSMIFFGLTFYCYGIAIYTVPVFLLLYAGWCLRKKILPLKTILLCIVIFVLTALPEILTMAINTFGWSTIKTPFFTIPYFPESIRSNDILFMDFSFRQLWENGKALVNQVFLQKQDWLHNAIPEYGPLYPFAVPFILIGLLRLLYESLSHKPGKKFCPGSNNPAFPANPVLPALWCSLAAALWAGLTTRQVNINRINIIFYPLLILCGYGISSVWEWIGQWKRFYRELCQTFLLVLFSLNVLGFFNSYVTDFPEQIEWYFCRDFLEITEEADAQDEFDTLYITGQMPWQYNHQMAEILTQYSCKVDAHYYQELTNANNGRQLLSYSQRYVYSDMAHLDFSDLNGLYILHQSEKKYLPDNYDILCENASYIAVFVKE